MRLVSFLSTQREKKEDAVNLRPIRPGLRSKPLSQKPTLRREEREGWRERRREGIQRGKEGRKDKRGIN